MIRRQSSSTTPPHMTERAIPTSPQLSRASINYLDGNDRIVQTPRRMKHMNGSSGMRPTSREGSATYARESSPAIPTLARAHTSDITVSRSRLPRQSQVAAPQHRLARQSTRESMNGMRDSPREQYFTPPERRKENASTPIEPVRRTPRNRNVEIHANNNQTLGRRIPTNRRNNTAPEDGWA